MNEKTVSGEFYSVYRIPAKGGMAEHVGDYLTDIAAWEAATGAADSDDGQGKWQKVEFCRSIHYSDKGGKDMIMAVVKRW